MKRMNKIPILFGILIALFISISFAAAQTPNAKYLGEFKKGQPVDLVTTCSLSTGLLCPSGYACNMTVAYPNSSLLVNFQQMTHVGSNYNLTLSDTSQTGNYDNVHVYCTNSTDAGDQDYFFKITDTGINQTPAQGSNSLIYCSFLIALTFFFGYTGFRLTDSEYLWGLGCFFLVFALLMSIFDLWVAYEAQALLSGIGSAQTIQVFFYILLTIIFAGLTVAVGMILKNWGRIKDRLVQAATATGDDGWDNDPYREDEEKFRKGNER